MKRFVTYCRVSTNSQGFGLGMASQTDTVRRYVQGQHGQVIGEFLEVESGGKTDAGRPKLAEALALAKKCKGVLVVAKLDRLSRNAEFLLRLQNAGVDFVCCDCPNVDRFTVGILALVAQRERELISERTKAALKIAKSRGVKLGAVNPQKQVKLMNAGARKAKEEFAAGILPIIREIQSTGVKTLQGVADCLNRRGILTRQGCQFFPTQVQVLLKG
ncbi:MAG: recombinase family protein [Verrucomicrobia bacterium]|nr:recombinase family protein [Verrucomicrobiota bacterium]